MADAFALGNAVDAARAFDAAADAAIDAAIRDWDEISFTTGRPHR